MICCVGDIIKRRLGSFFPLDHIEYTFSNRTMDKQIFWPVTFVRIEPNFFFVDVRTYIYTDVLQTFIYIPAFVTHNQYGSGRLIKLERRVDKRPQCRSNSASPSTLYPVHTHKHTKRKLSTFFSLFLMQLSEQNEKKKTHPSPPPQTYGWMLLGPPTPKKKRLICTEFLSGWSSSCTTSTRKTFTKCN